MIIRKMTATFGCLEGRTLELSPGLNVICAPNESGKSTWCAFMRAMLYGVDSSERARAGFLPDKLKYAPWSGAPMAGEMEISHAGRDITLRRSTRAQNAPMREFAAVYTGTGEKVPGLTGATAGEALVGAPRDVFRRSAFIGQGEAAISGSAELERRIAAVVSTGEEDVSWSEADGRLREWLRRRKYNKYGAIPALEGEIAADEEKLRGMTATAVELERRTAELELRRSEAEARGRALDRSRSDARSELGKSLAEARGRAERAEAAHRVAVAEAAKAEAEAAGGVFGGAGAEEARQEAEDSAHRLLELKSRAADRGSPALGVAFALLCLAGIAAGIFWQWYAFMGAAAALGGAVWALVRADKKRRAAAQAARESARLLGRYDAESPEDIRAAAEAHAARCAAAENARRVERRAGEELDAARSAAAAAEERYISAKDSPEDALRARELSALMSRIELLKSSVSELTGAAAAAGDHLALSAGLIEKRERLSELNRQYEALSLAIEALREADAELQLRFSPALGRRAAEYLSRLTGGRYDAVAVARDFSVTARLSGDAQQRDCLYMSAGAAELTYLAVRLAIVDLTLPEDEPCPIVLDDVLAGIDGARSARVLELLREIAEKRQVILFTCTEPASAQAEGE